MSDPFIGEIIIFAGNYAPRSWAFCDGQSIPVSQHVALYSLIGLVYGGDHNTAYHLPDMRGRAPIHCDLTGQVMLGSKAGLEKVGLIESQLPSHCHTAYVSGSGPAVKDFENNSLPTFPGLYIADDSHINPMNQEVISWEGGSQPHENMQPYIVLNYIIALDGVYPPRH